MIVFLCGEGDRDVESSNVPPGSSETDFLRSPSSAEEGSLLDEDGLHGPSPEPF